MREVGKVKRARVARQSLKSKLGNGKITLCNKFQLM